jgi:hypothetical protein
MLLKKSRRWPSQLKAKPKSLKLPQSQPAMMKKPAKSLLMPWKKWAKTA